MSNNDSTPKPEATRQRGAGRSWPAPDPLRYSRKEFPGLALIIAWAAGGALLLVLAWLLPVHWKSLAPSVVERAGKATQSAGQLGLAWLEVEKPGPAGLALTAAQSVRDPLAPKLAAGLANVSAGKMELAVWGGRDRQMESLFKASELATKHSGAPVLDILLTEAARTELRTYLGSSQVPGVQAMVRTRALTNTTTFVAVNRPGGQPFETVILLAGLLYQGEHFSPVLAQDLKARAEQAAQSPSDWETSCLNLLALAKRMNWVQLTELLRSVPDSQALSRFARIAQGPPETFAQAYVAAGLVQSAGQVATYLAKFEKQGGAYLAQALAHGQGSVRLLVERQLPVDPPGRTSLGFTAPLVLKAPKFALTLKLLGLAAAIFCFYRVWNELSAVESVEDLANQSSGLQMRRGAVALVSALILIASSEPFIFVRAGAPALTPQLKLPVLSNTAVAESPNRPARSQSMNLDMSTILSIALFAALQVIVYAICLMKINEIDRQHGPPQLKLRLMENEENLFDAGLYVGIAGTAAALVLQVMQVIQANLLAAYSSNLFGIVCVALVKIRHVRAYKRKLIIRCQVENSNPAPVMTSASAPAVETPARSAA